MSKTVVEQTDNGVGPLPNNHTFVNEVADLKHTKKINTFVCSFTTVLYLTCRGMASQHTPNSAHFLGVRK